MIAVVDIVLEVDIVVLYEMAAVGEVLDKTVPCSEAFVADEDTVSLVEVSRLLAVVKSVVLA